MGALATHERREARRRRLLEAALHLFTEVGYHDTSVDDVVAEARTSKSAFYEYFESKEDCFRVLLEQEGGELIAAVNAAAMLGIDHRDRMRRGIHAFVAACIGRSRVARLLLIESVGLSRSIEEVRRRLHDEFAKLAEQAARYAQERGDQELAGLDPAVYGRVIVGAVNEATIWCLEAGASDDASALADQICRALSV
jgi:AcrR family transcriptional regulator